MHPSLPTKHIQNRRIIFRQMRTIQTFKQGILQIDQTYSSQAFIKHFGLFLALKRHGRKLFMVAYQDKLAHSIPSVGRLGGQEPQQLRFEYLSGLIDNRHIKTLQLEEFRFGRKGSHRADINSTSRQPLTNVLTFIIIRQDVFYQMRPITFITRKLTPDTDVVDRRNNSTQGRADFIHRPIGISQQ